jgi:hypothetical protein
MQLPDSCVKVMCEAWREMNAVRARDGVPYCHDGRQSDVSQEYWDDIMARLDKEVLDATGHDCWLHPALYVQPQIKNGSVVENESNGNA